MSNRNRCRCHSMADTRFTVAFDTATDRYVAYQWCPNAGPGHSSDLRRHTYGTYGGAGEEAESRNMLRREHIMRGDLPAIDWYLTEWALAIHDRLGLPDRCVTCNKPVPDHGVCVDRCSQMTED